MKPINLPSWKKVTLDIDHIFSGHIVGGNRAVQSGRKDLFPTWMTKEQVEKAVETAYNNAKKVGSQGNVVELEGYAEGMKIKNVSKLRN